MFNLNDITDENNKNHNEKWPYISDYSYRILIIGGSGSRKTNTLLNLINEQDNMDKIYWCAKDLSERKYEFLTKKRGKVVIKQLNDPKAFIQSSNTMKDVDENIDDYKTIIKRKTLIDFYDMIVGIVSNKKFQATAKDWFIRIFHLFLFHSLFSVPKDVSLSTTHFFVMKINEKRELQNYCN